MGSRKVARPTRRVRAALSVAVQIAMAMVPALAAAAPTRTAKLTYSRGAGASDCPDAEVIRSGVAARLGYEPFDDRAELLVSATVNRTGRTLEARIQIGGAVGQVTAERKLVSRQSDCVELASEIELAISIAIDSLAGNRPRADSSPPPPPAAPAPPPPAPPAPIVIVVREPAPPPAPAPKPAPPSAPIGFQARLGWLGTLGSAPAPAMGGTVQASARRGSFSIGLEGRGDLPSTTSFHRGDAPVAEMHAWLLMGSLVPCASRGVLEGCALLSGGVIRASATNLAMPQQVSAPLLAAGARVGLEIPLGSVLSGGVHLDVLAAITETVLRISGNPVWTSPPISAALGATLGARFP